MSETTPSTNGSTVAPATSEAAVRGKVEELLAAAIRQIIGVMIRGLLVSSPGVLPHVLMNMIARETGKLLSESVQADLSTLFQLRKGFQDAFREGVRSGKLAQPGMPSGSMNVNS